MHLQHFATALLQLEEHQYVLGLANIASGVDFASADGALCAWHASGLAWLGDCHFMLCCGRHRLETAQSP